MKKIRYFLFVLLFLLISGAAQATGVNEMFGVWGSLTLRGNLKFLSPQLETIDWIVMNQSRTRDDSRDGSRFTENLLFAQLGYSVTKLASVWLGYTHDWIHPLNKRSYHENRPYLDFVWQQPLADLNLIARTRFEARINQTTGDDGYRGRQLLQLNYALPCFKNASLYVGDEIFFYMNRNDFGKRGFTENRVLAGLSYQMTPAIGMDLGYMGQFVNSFTGDNLFTHNLQANVSYRF